MNPFAKRPSAANESVSNSGKANPFLRKPERTRSLHKSETFFEKVNAAESEAEKGKRAYIITKYTETY